MLKLLLTRLLTLLLQPVKPLKALLLQPPKLLLKRLPMLLLQPQKLLKALLPLLKKLLSKLFATSESGKGGAARRRPFPLRAIQTEWADQPPL